MEINYDEEPKPELEEPAEFTIDPGILRFHNLRSMIISLKLFLDFPMDPEILGEAIVSVNFSCQS